MLRTLGGHCPDRILDADSETMIRGAAAFDGRGTGAWAVLSNVQCVSGLGDARAGPWASFAVNRGHQRLSATLR